MPKQQGLYFQTTGYTRPKCSRKKPTNNANDTSQRFVEVFKTIFLCFRLPRRRKWRWRAVWTLIKVLRTFLSNGQTEMPQTKKKSKWAAFWRLSNSRWSLADKEILTVVIGQFPELSFYQNLELDWLFFNPINGRIVFFCLKILIRCEICVSFL